MPFTEIELTDQIRAYRNRLSITSIGRSFITKLKIIIRSSEVSRMRDENPDVSIRITVEADYAYR